MVSDLDLSAVPGAVTLLGVGGSNAFGLATATSDVDYRGVYVVPTRDLFRLRPPAENYSTSAPDVALTEVGKFIRQASAANPTALEALFYDEYIIRSTVGAMLLENRWLFITDKIRATHLGFAENQFKMLQKRGKEVGEAKVKRAAKHARHTLRLIRLTEKVLTTGDYDITVDDRDEIFDFGEADYTEQVRIAATEITRLRSIKSVLHPEPDMAKIEDLLIEIREMSL